MQKVGKEALAGEVKRLVLLHKVDRQEWRKRPCPRAGAYCSPLRAEWQAHSGNQAFFRNIRILDQIYGYSDRITTLSRRSLSGLMNFPQPHPTSMSSRDALPPVNRYITTHSASGESVLETTIPSTPIWRHIPEASFFLGYVTKTFPVELNDDFDLQAYTDAFASPPQVTVPGGTVLRVMDLGPGTSSPMHRTVSLDYSVVLEGEVELELDSGDRKTMRRGDMCVQRATNHAWRNVSQTEWARMLYVHVDATKPIVEGRELGESMEV